MMDITAFCFLLHGQRPNLGQNQSPQKIKERVRRGIHRSIRQIPGARNHVGLRSTWRLWANKTETNLSKLFCQTYGRITREWDTYIVFARLISRESKDCPNPRKIIILQQGSPRALWNVVRLRTKSCEQYDSSTEVGRETVASKFS